MSDTLRQTYEETLYPGLAFAQTHPDRLAMLATLLGLIPAPITNCRVLEIGCASGHNLIPMAYSLPGSQFTGIDFAPSQIQAGEQMRQALQLDNVTLLTLDILDVTPALGQFDYIIAHGIYSWVPPTVRDKVIQICQQNLAPHGIAYVSYNAYPGWHLLGIIREAMLYRTRGVTDPQEKATLAKGVLDFMIKAVPTSDNSYSRFLQPYLTFLQEQMERVGDKAEGFLLHDELELVNDAVYFHQFADHAAQHGLQYLTETELSTVMPTRFPAEVMQAIGTMAGNIVEMEQYMDFVRNRVFRQTLLCHADIEINRSMNATRLQAFQIASRAEIVSDSPNLFDVSVEQFRGYEGGTLSLEHPVSKAAMGYLIEQWPRLVSFGDLLGVARARVSQHNGVLHEMPVDARDLAVNLLQAYTHSSQLVEFHSYQPPFVFDISEYPVASPIARYEARSSVKVTNLYHEIVNLDEMNAYLIQHLDGQHDKTRLVDKLMQLVDDGTVQIKPQSPPLTTTDQIRTFLATRLDQQLHWLAKAALLVG